MDWTYNSDNFFDNFALRACMARLKPPTSVSAAPPHHTPGISCENRRDRAKLASRTHSNNKYQMRRVNIYQCAQVLSVCVCVSTLRPP